MGVVPVPSRYVPTSLGGWTLADGWRLHGKSYDQRDGSEGYDPDADPASIADDDTDDSDMSSNSPLPTGDNLSDTGDVGGSPNFAPSPSADLAAVSSAAASLAASATVVPTATVTPGATGTAVVAGHNAGSATASSATSSSTAAGFSPTDLPTGWEPAPSRTSYYTVPLIIALALLLALFIVASIAACVWRNQRKKKLIARAKARKAADGSSDMDGEMWLDLERLRIGMHKEIERRRKEKEKEARKEMRAWVGAEGKWKARLMLRKRGVRRRRSRSGDKTEEEREKEVVDAVSTGVDSSRVSGSFVRSTAPSPSSRRTSEDLPPAPSSTPIHPSSLLSQNDLRHLPSGSSSRSPSPSPSFPAFRPPAYPTTPTEDDMPIASTSTAEMRHMYPDLPPSPPPPPASLRALVIPSRAHIATDDKRLLARMGRATFPRSDAEATQDEQQPDVPEWTDEDPPHPVHPSHPRYAQQSYDNTQCLDSQEDEEYVPHPPRSTASSDGDAFSFAGGSLPPPPPAFQHAVELDHPMPFDPGLGFSFPHSQEQASAPYEDWDEYGGASAPPLDDDDDDRGPENLHSREEQRQLAAASQVDVQDR